MSVKKTGSVAGVCEKSRCVRSNRKGECLEMVSKEIAVGVVLAFLLGRKNAHADAGESLLHDEEVSTSSNFFKEIEDNSRYRTLEANATLLKLLVDDKDGVSRSEVLDMLNSRDDDPSHIDLPSFPADRVIEETDFSTPDSQAEYLQAPSIAVNGGRTEEYGRGEARGVAAAMAAMMLATAGLVCAAYFAFTFTRTIYLQKNGLKHELLHNEDTVAETRLEL